MKKKHLVLLSLSIFTSIALVNVIGIGLGKNNDKLTKSEQDNYNLVFDSKNSIKNDVTKQTNFNITTNNGNNINFEGNNLTSYKNGFATFNSDGYFRNIDQITSIKSLVVKFSGDLNFRSSYDGVKYKEYIALNTDHLYNFSSDFYYFELSSTSGAVVTNFKITYSCSPNTEIDNKPKEITYELVEENLTDYTGTYVVGYVSGNNVKVFNGLEDKNNFVAYTSYNEEIIKNFTSPAELEIEKYNSGYSIKVVGGTNDGKYLSGVSGSNTIAFSNAKVANTIKYDVEMNISSNTSYLRFNPSANMFRYYKNSSYTDQEAISLFKKNEGGITTLPSDEMGFEISDNGTYTTNTNFKESNKLVVNAIYSDGKKLPITNSDYTYRIVNSDNQIINPEANFPKAGQYRLYIEYKNYSSKDILINVSEYKQISSINLSMKLVDFTTNDKLATYLDDNLSFNINYINGESYTSKKYSDLSTYGLSVNLLDPNNKSFNINNYFTTLGEYKLSIGDKNVTSNIITLNVTAPIKELDEYTVLIYMCGSDLESDGSYATKDLEEIALVTGQPDNVNIVIEAGGARSWNSKYSKVVNKDKLSRFHLVNQNYVLDQQLSNASMGLSSTLESFVTWGINKYEAKKMALILWNHGGAMDGVCADENYKYDMLTTSEVDAAITNAFKATSYNSKFEWIGYDACLMQVQEIASINSKHFNYMIASEESENGEGWDYDSFLDDLYALKDTKTILKAAVDGFIADNGGLSDRRNDQTLSYLDLSYMDSYVNAFNDMATYLSNNVITSQAKWNSFANVCNTAIKFGYYDTSDDGNWGEDYNNGYLYDVFDVKDVFKKLLANSTYKSDTTLVNHLNNLNSILNDLIVYESHGKASANATGLTMFIPICGYNPTSIYTKDMTRFTAYRDLVITYGDWYQG